MTQTLPRPARRPLRLLIAPALAIGIAASAIPRGAARAAPAVIHHDLTVALNPAGGTLAATDVLTLRPDGAERVTLSISDGALVSRIAVDGQALPLKLAASSGGSLAVPIPPAARDGTVRVEVTYEAAFRDPVPADRANAEDPSYGVRGAITPAGTFLSGTARWYPDLTESLATFRVRVEAPEGVEAVTAGRLVRRGTEGGRTFSEWEVALRLEGLALAAGRYVVRESTAGKVKVYTCFLPENDPLSAGYHRAVGRYLALYEPFFGPYPFEKFAVVENFFPTGYGFPSWTLLGSAVIRLPFIVETSLGHEIAHSWWGNGVLVDSNGGNWSEGLVTYMADHLYKEMSSAAEGREYRLNLLRDYAALVPPEKDFPLRAFGARADPATRAVGYGKAAMVFHMARRRAGDEAFHEGLREVAREKFGKPASWDDLIRAFTRRGGRALDSFIAQWVDRPGAPKIALRDVRARADGDHWNVTGRLVQEKPYYDLRVPLRIVGEGGQENAVVSLGGAEARFTLPSPGRPRRLVADPEADLFRRLDPSEIPPSVNGIKGSTALLVVAARGLPPETLDAAKALLEAMGREGTTVLPEEEVSPSRLAGHDVLYLGLPRLSGFLPALPEGLEMTPSSFRIAGRSFEAHGDALFAVLPHPAQSARVAAVFLPLSADAASAAARKIPHYGRYSYLAFSGGTNRVKGGWEPVESPTVHLFPTDGDSAR